MSNSTPSDEDPECKYHILFLFSLCLICIITIFIYASQAVILIDISHCRSSQVCLLCFLLIPCFAYNLLFESQFVIRVFIFSETSFCSRAYGLEVYAPAIIGNRRLPPATLTFRCAALSRSSAASFSDQHYSQLPNFAIHTQHHESR